MLFIIKKLIAYQEKKKFYAVSFFIFIVFVGIVRGLQEKLIFRDPILYSHEFLIIISFYSVMYLQTVLILKLIIKTKSTRLFSVSLLGLFLGLFPPLIDFLFLSARFDTFRYSYQMYVFSSDNFIWSQLLFYINPMRMMGIGESVVIWATIFFTAYYVYLKKNFRSAVVAWLAMYFGFILQSILLPSLVYEFFYYLKGKGFDHLSRSIFYIAYFQLLLSIAFCFLIFSSLRKSTLKRLPHVLPFLSIAISGIIIRNLWGIDAFFLVVTVTFLFYAIASQNDYYDKKLDRMRKKNIQTSYMAMVFLNGIMMLLIIFLFANNHNYSLVLTIILLTSFLYHSDFYRGKKELLTNMKIEAVWGGGAFLTALLLDAQKILSNIELEMTFLLFGGWSLISNLKDFKDLRHDYRDDYRTLPVTLMMKGYSLKKIYFNTSILLNMLFFIPVLNLIFIKDFYSSVSLLILSIILFGLPLYKFLNARVYQVHLLLTSIYFILYAYLSSQVS